MVARAAAFTAEAARKGFGFFFLDGTLAPILAGRGPVTDAARA